MLEPHRGCCSQISESFTIAWGRVVPGHKPGWEQGSQLFGEIFVEGLRVWGGGASPVAQLVKNLSANAGNVRNMSSGRFPGEGNGNLLQYSCLESSTDRGTWQATAHQVTRVRYD